MKLHLNINKKALFSFCCLLITLAILSACSTNDDLTGEIIFDTDTIPEQEISAFGEAAPVKWATLSFPMGAGDLDIRVEKGEEVTNNQRLVVSNDNQLNLNFYQTQSALIRAQYAYDEIKRLPPKPALAAAEAALANAEANYDRLEATFALDSQLDAAQADIDAAKANLTDLRAGASKQEIEAAEADLRSAEIAFDLAVKAFEIRAPFDGTVVDIFIRTGEVIGAYQPVLILADLSEMQVITTDLSEIDVTRVRVGQRASIVFDAIPEQTFEGTVVRIAEKSTGVTSVYYEVVIQPNNLPREIRWGMTAFIVFASD